MKYKQSNPKSVRQLSTNKISCSANKHRVRCSLCDSLLKASISHRYLLEGKSIHDNLDKNITYKECCQQYLNGTYDSNKLNMICLRCCHTLNQIYSLRRDADELMKKIRHTWLKTKRLNRTRYSYSKFLPANDNTSSSPLPTVATDENITITVKEELNIEQVPCVMNLSTGPTPIAISKTVLVNNQNDLINIPAIDNKMHILNGPNSSYESNDFIIGGSKKKSSTKKQSKLFSTTENISLRQSKKSQPTIADTSYLANQVSHSMILNSHGLHSNILSKSTINNQISSPYNQLTMNSLSIDRHQQNAEIPYHQRRCSSSSNCEQAPLLINYPASSDGEQSFSPNTLDDETSSNNEMKTARLSRRQYQFLVKLSDQQSLNAFIETSSNESNSRWTWRRTSANSRGYKVYYVCNFSMRRHYHPCPAAMYALFHPEGSISIYSCGQHQHIPKDRIPVSITDSTKEEIFKCLKVGMATTEIREHLTRLQLPFGDTRKLNNFIKYHKELLRFGTVTNVRIGGTAYRQPQCWAIRRQAKGSSSVSTVDNDNNVEAAAAATTTTTC